MIYLSGSMHAIHADLYAEGRIGLMQTVATGSRLDRVAVWAMDNGCYTNSYPGDNAYFRLLARLSRHSSRCLFVAMPDVVGDAGATFDLFDAAENMRSRIRVLGYPIALVAQDGMQPEDIPWDELDFLFLGGTTEWKLGPGARLLAAHAKQRGKGLHVGRVNSAKRYRYAATQLLADSADGTFLAFSNPSRGIDEILQWSTITTLRK